jgi:hypothetical protein
VVMRQHKVCVCVWHSVWRGMMGSPLKLNHHYLHISQFDKLREPELSVCTATIRSVLLNLFFHCARGNLDLTIRIQIKF